RTVEREADLRGRDRPDPGAAVGAREAERRSRAAADGGAAAGDDVAPFVDGARVEDRRDVENALADGFDDPGPLDGPAAPDGHSRRGQCGDLGPARPAVPGAGRSRPPASAPGDI